MIIPVYCLWLGPPCSVWWRRLPRLLCGLSIALALFPRSAATPAPAPGTATAAASARGRNANDGPFYLENPDFDEAMKRMKELEPSSTVSSETVQYLHETFLKSSDQDQVIWDGWNRLCSVVEGLSSITGCLDAPSALTGWSAAHLAAMFGQLDKLKWLAAHGADLDVPSSAGSKRLKQTGFTPAHSAVLHDQLEALELLDALGADVLRPSPGGHTPLDVARSRASESDSFNHGILAWLVAKQSTSGRGVHQSSPESTTEL